MWNTISNISSIVTCFLFVLYIIGHIWRVFIIIQSKYEKVNFIYFERMDDIEEYDNNFILDSVGDIFSLSSEYGIKNIKVFDITFDENEKNEFIITNKVFKGIFHNYNPKDEVCIRCNLGEYTPLVLFEIERLDYIKVSFTIQTNGKTGNFFITDYKYKMTLKSFLYYLCS